MRIFIASFPCQLIFVRACVSSGSSSPTRTGTSCFSKRANFLLFFSFVFVFFCVSSPSVSSLGEGSRHLQGESFQTTIVRIPIPFLSANSCFRRTDSDAFHSPPPSCPTTPHSSRAGSVWTSLESAKGFMLDLVRSVFRQSFTLTTLTILKW